MKIMIIYDSLGGNTGKMAKAISEGASSVAGAVVEVKKIGEPFPLSLVAKADGVAFGSPCIYADITDGMRSFIDHLKRFIKDAKMDTKDRKAAIFGSYGWDGALIMEQRFKETVKDLGYKLKDDVAVEVDTNIKYHADLHLEKWKEFGRKFAESLKS